jgi:putative transposase
VHRQGPARQKGGAGEAEATGANPTDRSQSGSKRHTLTAGRGLPIATILSGANRTDMKKLAALLDAKVLEEPPPPPEPAGPGPERHLSLDRGYDYDECREAAEARGYTVHIPPPRGAERPLPPPGHPERHPPRRWVVEVAHSWCNRFRRLLIRWEKQADNYLGFVQLAACLIIYRKLRHARALSG